MVGSKTAPITQRGFTTGATGSANVAVPLPNDSSLIGVQLYAQALVTGGGFSNGVVWTIGP